MDKKLEKKIKDRHGKNKKGFKKKGICNKFNKPCQEVAQSIECVSVEKWLFFLYRNMLQFLHQRKIFPKPF